MERLRRVFDEGPLGIAVLDATYRLVDVNSRFCDMLGYARDELMSLTFPEFTHPEDISKDVSLAAKLFRGEIPSYEIEKRFIMKDGEVVWGLLHASVVHDESGEPEFGLEMVEDITERKRDFEALFNNQQDGVALVVEDRFSRVNARFAELLGRSEQELGGMPPAEVLVPEDRDRNAERRREILAGGAQFPSQYDIVRPDGTTLSIQAISRPVEHEGKPALLSFVRDVSELEAARRALEQSEERFRRLSEGAIEGTAISEQGIMLDANPQFARLFGYELSELVGVSVSSLVAPESRELVSKQIAAGNDRPYEHLAIRKDGTIFPVQAHGKAMEYEGRTVRVTNIRDITERRRADEALRESEEKWRSLAENAPDFVFLVGPDEKIQYANRVSSGQRMEDVIGTSVFNYIVPEYHGAARSAMARVFESRTTETFENKVAVPPGSESWFSNRLSPIIVGGHVVSVAYISTDITERREAEEALQESEAKLRTVTEASPAAILVIQAGKIPFANPAMVEGSEYDASELAELNYLELFLPDGREEAERRVEACLDGSELYQTWRHLTITKSGVEGWFETTIGPAQFQGRPAVIAVSTDVTGNVRAEQALRESEERHRLLIDSSLDGILAYDTDIRYTLWNRAMEKITGFEKERVIGQQAFEVFPFLTDVSESDAMKQALEGKPGRLLEMPFTIPQTGREGYFESSHVPLRDAQGKIVGGMGIIRDITDRKLAEEELQQSEVRFSELAETSQAAIFIVAGVKLVYANPAGERLTGRSLDELQTIDFWEVAHPDDRKALVEHFDVPRAVGELASPYAFRVVKPDGKVRWAEASAAMTTFKGENAGAVILLDVTDRVLAEQATQLAREELEGKVERQMLRKNPYELTFRELTVLHHVAAGEADKEIAAELGISPLTAQNHVASILRKMDASSRTAAGVRAVRDGLVD